MIKTLCLLGLFVVAAQAIINGYSANIEDYPYQALLETNKEIFCGATIIGKKYVLTAAHCTNGINLNNMQIRVGSTFRNEGGQVIKISEVFQHPKHTYMNFDYDLSVIKLEEEIVTANAEAIEMVNESYTLKDGELGTLCGWGTIKPDGKLEDNMQLRVIKVPIMNKLDCQRRYPMRLLSNQMFCTSVENGDGCIGDDGGALVVNGKLVGLSSWALGCGVNPAVYTDIASLRSFIREKSGI